MDKKKKLIGRMQKKLDKLTHITTITELSENLNDNETALRDTFSDCADLAVRRFHAYNAIPCMLVYLDVLVDGKKLDEDLLKPLMNQETVDVDCLSLPAELLKEKLVPIGNTKLIGDPKEIVQRITTGDVILFMEASKQAISLGMKNQLHRKLEEPNTEAVIRGPRLGFVETLPVNMALIRHLLRTPQLKMIKMTIGAVSQTDVAIVYIENMAPHNVVEEVKKRVSSIEMDSIMESGYIEEWISDKHYSPFPLMRKTERPDAIAASLVTGKVAILTNGTPIALIAPVTFWYGFETVEDYYMNFLFATMLRWLRYLFAFIAMMMPSIFVAITTFHHEMIPTSLALSLAGAREIVPFPAMIETLIMEVTFEALREAGVRLPRPVGQTISIVGALVIGEAAVQAGIISSPIIIVVSLTGIATFLIPQPSMSQAFSMMRFPMMFLAGMFGLYGLGTGMLAILIHLVNLRSFGVPYLTPIAPFNSSGLWDVWLRAPWRVLYKRQQYTRQKLELGKK